MMSKEAQKWRPRRVRALQTKGFGDEPAASDGNKASNPPPHRAGTVPGFLSDLLTLRTTAKPEFGAPPILDLTTIGLWIGNAKHPTSGNRARNHPVSVWRDFCTAALAAHSRRDVSCSCGDRPNCRPRRSPLYFCLPIVTSDRVQSGDIRKIATHHEESTSRKPMTCPPPRQNAKTLT